MLRTAVKFALRCMDLEVLVVRRSSNMAYINSSAGYEVGSAVRGTVREAYVSGVDLNFFIHDESDHIQSYHLKGEFYEQEELNLIGKHFDGGCFVDIGANVGNHSIYAAKVLGASRIIAFEPNATAQRIFQLNALLNQMTSITSLHCFALSDKPGVGSIVVPPSNLGGGRIVFDEWQGSFQIKSGDEILAGEDVSFIKIDTEGFEIEVLSGLTGGIL